MTRRAVLVGGFVAALTTVVVGQRLRDAAPGHTDDVSLSKDAPLPSAAVTDVVDGGSASSVESYDLDGGAADTTSGGFVASITG